jgi:hypothetical protein
MGREGDEGCVGGVSHCAFIKKEWRDGQI